MVGFALQFAENYGVNSVFEFIDFDPKLLVDFKYRGNVEIYYLANLDANIDNIREDLIKYSKPYDWPTTCTEDDMIRNIKFILKKNKELVEECEKYRFTLINTSRGDNREKMLNELTAKIIDKPLEKTFNFCNDLIYVFYELN